MMGEERRTPGCRLTWGRLVLCVQWLGWARPSGSRLPSMHTIGSARHTTDPGRGPLILWRGI